MRKKVICNNCGKEIKAGDKFTAEIIMPKSIVMPVGRFDTILAEKAINIICEDCNVSSK